ncbi:hypothetical protein [Halosegnis longus]|uniref:hypothetical protein n=1 Tax=Halosegnis longus TaxID=2216012 RepID=UPI00129ECF36|nr:hypothetical protein [Halosegnis longus]
MSDPIEEGDNVFYILPALAPYTSEPMVVEAKVSKVHDDGQLTLIHRPYPMEQYNFREPTVDRDDVYVKRDDLPEQFQ